MESGMNRRGLLKAGAAFSVMGASQVFTAIPALADFAAGPTLRRNASTMAANDPILRGYRRAILAMRALPNNNPCSWFYQAAIHGTTDPSNLPAWNTCHFNNAQWFWAWHRMYLYWFERIVREYSGMYDWAIPYWDWTNVAQRALPAPFRDSSSPLFEASRSGPANAGTPLSTNLATSVNNAMGLVDYYSTQNSINNGPHGSVHVTIGGKMGAVSSAAQDPIFWAHHAQIDRIVNLWLAQGGGRSNPIGDSTWKNKTFIFFDECCQQVQMKGCDVLRAAQQLSYAYEGEPPQVNQYCPLRWNVALADVAVLSQSRASLILGPAPARVPLIPREGLRSVRRLTEIARSGRQNLALRLGSIEADTQPGITWEVHVGPRGFAPDSRSFVGLLALFAAGLRDRGQAFQPAELVLPIGKALRALDPAGLEVAFVPVSGFERGLAAEAVQPRSPVRIGEVAIIVDQPMPQPPREEQERLRKQAESE